MCFNSSWVIFPLRPRADKKADELDPSSFFGKSVQLELHERTLIRNLRKWVSQQFAAHLMLSSQFITKLSDVPQAGVPTKEKPDLFPDFDVQVKVVQIVRMDQYKSAVTLIDESNELWHAQTYNAKYKYLREGQYVRIRACSLMHFHKKGYERSFGFKPISNIMILPQPCKIAEQILFDEQAVMDEFVVTTLASEAPIMKPIVISRVTDQAIASAPITYLSRLGAETRSEQGDSLHHVRV